MKYKLTIDGKTQIVDIEEAEESGWAERLAGIDLRGDMLTDSINQVDAQLGLALMRLDAIEKRLNDQTAAQ